MDMILSHTVGRGTNESQMKTLNLIRDRTKVVYCFNSKGENFDVNQLKDIAKN